jgi:hypothetical protein
MQLLTHLGLQTLGQLVEHIQSSVIPTPLMASGGKDLVQCRPQPQRAVADRQQRRLV